VVADACEGVDVEPWHIEDRSLRKESGGPTLEAGQELITEDFRVKRAIRGAFEGATVPDSGRSDGGGPSRQRLGHIRRAWHQLEWHTSFNLGTSN
jgi:hypothetical protein